VAEKKTAAIKALLQPRPQLIVSCTGKDGKDNALAVEYACNCSFNPPMIVVAVTPGRYSHHMIKESGCFVANMVGAANIEAYRYLGSHSGRDGDKLAACGMKLLRGDVVNAPILADCPVSIECTVSGSIMAGSHELFVGKIERIHANAELVKEDGSIDWSKADLLAP